MTILSVSCLDTIIFLFLPTKSTFKETRANDNRTDYSFLELESNKRESRDMAQSASGAV